MIRDLIRRFLDRELSELRDRVVEIERERDWWRSQHRMAVEEARRARLGEAEWRAVAERSVR